MFDEVFFHNCSIFFNFLIYISIFILLKCNNQRLNQRHVNGLNYPTYATLTIHITKLSNKNRTIFKNKYRITRKNRIPRKPCVRLPISYLCEEERCEPLHERTPHPSMERWITSGIKSASYHGVRDVVLVIFQSTQEHVSDVRMSASYVISFFRI